MNLKYFLFPVVTGLIIILILILIRKGPTFNINKNQTAVVKEIQQLNKLETAQFTIEKIIDAKASSGNVFEEFLYGDKILLIAHGEVIAGFDLSKMQKDSVIVQGSRLSIKLPAPQILITKIDNDKTKVYDRKQGILTKGSKDLESEARKSAELSIKQAACDANILEHASANVKKQFKTMFSPYGYSEISIDIPRGNCQ